MRPVCIRAVTGQQNADGRGTPTRRGSVRVRGFATWLGLEGSRIRRGRAALAALPARPRAAEGFAAFRDGLNDARRQIGKRRQEPDLALFGGTTVILSSRAAAFDSMIS